MRHNNSLTMSLPFFFFFENGKNLGWSEDAKRRKKTEDGLNSFSEKGL